MISLPSPIMRSQLAGPHVTACAYGSSAHTLASMIGSGTAAVAAAGRLAGPGYYLVVTGKLTIDTGWAAGSVPSAGLASQIGTPSARVFEVIAAPYLGRTPRAASGKLRVLQRATDMARQALHAGAPGQAHPLRRFGGTCDASGLVRGGEMLL